MQVYLAIRGYVPEKSQTANTKTGILAWNKANLGLKLAVFHRYSRILCPRIIKIANNKTAKNEGRLYI